MILTGPVTATPSILRRLRNVLSSLFDLSEVGRAIWGFFANYLLFLDLGFFALIRGIAFNLLQGRFSVAYIHKGCRFLSLRDIKLGRRVIIKTGARLRGPLEIGSDSTIDEGVVLTGPTKIGRRCHVNYQAWIDRYVTLEDNVGVGHRSFLLTFNHDASDREGRWFGNLEFKEIHVERGSWIGAMVFLLPGVRIGSSSIIGAGSVVTKDIPANVLAVGNPARVKKELS